MRMSSSTSSEGVVRRVLGEYVRAVGSAGTDGSVALAGCGAIAELEERLARHYGMRHAVCVSSATTGLMALVLALDLSTAEIVTAPISYGATVAPLLALGSKIVFADVERGTLGLDPASVRKVIGPNTRAILAVDVLGVPSDTRALREVADRAGIWYLADAAQSLGASRDGVPASACADALVVSFGPGKTVFSGGEGGAVITDNEDIYRRVLWWTQHPLRHARELGTGQVNEFALNGRMHGLAAAWANAVFDESLGRLRSHQEHCFRMLDVLSDGDWIDLPSWRGRAIRPAFFRLGAAWKSKPNVPGLEDYLAGRGYAASVGALPVRVLYKEPPFLARAGSRLSSDAACPVAEQEVARHFTLELTGEP